MIKYPTCIDGQFAIIAPSQGANHESGEKFTAELALAGGVRVRTHGELDVVRVLDPQGATIGLFLGDVVDNSVGAVLDRDFVQEGPNDVSSIDPWIERNVYRYSGRHIFVLSCAHGNRIYLDAGGMLPVVYDSSKRAAGSTAAAILSPDEFEERFDRDLFETLGIFRDGWFPAGLTAHHGLNRLLPNFYLDLDTWLPHRHWPLRQIEADPDPHRVIREIGQEIRRNVAPYLGAGDLFLALTGGYETRLILSVCRDIADRVRFVCFFKTEGDRDLLLAQALARRLGVKLDTHEFAVASDDEAMEWVARSGYCAGEGRYSHATLKKLSADAHLVGGVAGEVGRGFFWRPKDDSTRRLTAADIVSRMALPRATAVDTAVSQWHQTVEDFDPLLQLDLAYLELRVSCWAAVQAYSTLKPRRVYPLVSRRIFTGMLMLPPDWRRDERWIREAIRDSWPEALDVPFNSLGVVKDNLLLIRRAASRPGLIVRRIKRKFL
ncbi:hypothetical protein [Sphingosinicella humi]|uniref:Asparagine synthetase domain-containing protein n=1 Tax=Allosphingosinicella humi TaxID=2068657 RepID=A0A2U2J548_9SPHN|nr:hypothetical protein [Sphingosinicella humi]PWG03432.1 hypothetical protein DF286_11545 [Sphingosinicella humi]